MRVRLLDVADHADVSKATASLVLNGKDGAIGEATRQRVLDAANDLGYRPNVVAQNLRSKRTSTIAILSDQVVTTPYAGAMIEGAQELADARGYGLLLSNIVPGRTNIDRAVDTLLDRQVDAVIYASMYHKVIDLPEALIGVPTVVMNARPSDPDAAPWVVPDDEGGARNAMQYLIDAGHTKIALADVYDEPVASVERRKAYEDVLAENGVALRPGWIASGTSDASGGRMAAEQILSGPDKPTAIFAFNDQMASGVAHAAHRVGLSIPMDLSIVGYDNQVLVAEAMDPGLTTVELPHREMGCWAMERIFDLLDEKAGTPGKRMPCPLVERESVAPPRTD